VLVLVLDLRLSLLVLDPRDDMAETSTRVAPGGCPPGAPTDPDVRDYRIRLFVTRVRYAREYGLAILAVGSG
jgi:hypothetical protein